MRKLFRYLIYLVVIPFIASVPGFVCCFCNLILLSGVLVPVLALALYLFFRKLVDWREAAYANGIGFLIYLLGLTVVMVLARGNLQGPLVVGFAQTAIPFLPELLALGIMDRYGLLYAVVFATYGLCFGLCAYQAKLPLKRFRILFLMAGIALVVNSVLYVNRPAVKYGGHGFQYMHGFSSTDFADYTVYTQNSRLVSPDHVPDFQIEDPEEMPVMDGAEACYPLYAAIAKALYKDIDVIEKEYAKTDPYMNGRIVSFSNTVVGFDRLVMGGDPSLDYKDGIDLFFGARPSEEQMDFARMAGVDVTVTPIGREGFVFFAEKDNPVEGLTSQQVKAIYSGEITNWKEVGGKDQEIRAFQRPENSGSQTMMVYFMGGAGNLKEPDTYEVVNAMMGVIRRVAQYHDEAGALGYSFRYFVEELNQEENVKLLAIDGVYPTLEAIEDGTYPLTVDLCLMSRTEDENPNVQRVVDYILSEDGQDIVRKTGYAGLAD